MAHYESTLQLYSQPLHLIQRIRIDRNPPSNSRINKYEIEKNIYALTPKFVWRWYIRLEYEQIKFIVISGRTVQASNGSKKSSTSNEMAQLNWKVPK